MGDKVMSQNVKIPLGIKIIIAFFLLSAIRSGPGETAPSVVSA